MKLKNLKRAVFTAILFSLLNGCNNVNAGYVENSTDTATLKLSAEGVLSDWQIEIQKSVLERTILPDNPIEITDDTLSFVLEGKSSSGKSYGPEKIFVTNNSGTITFADIQLPALQWTLSLTAYTGSITVNDSAVDTIGNDAKAVLKDTIVVDLSAGSVTNSSFLMSKKGLKTPGSITLSGTFTDSDNIVKSYQAGIYSKETGLLVDGTLKEVSDATNDDTFSFEAQDVAAGSYLYKMIFKNDSGKVIGCFTDTIIVEPGNDLNQTLTIDVISRIPESPADFKAYLVEGSESEGTYNVKLSWILAKYASNYELLVTEYSDATFTTSTSTIYGLKSSVSSDAVDSVPVEDFVGSALYYSESDDSSSLLYGDTSCVITLETGKLYDIKIGARNAVGSSYRELVTGFVSRSDASDETGLKGFSSANKINRTKIKYNLNGATLTVSGVIYTDFYTAYNSYTQNELLLDVSGADASISNNSKTFNGWSLIEGTGIDSSDSEVTISSTDKKVTKYSFKDLTVEALFGDPSVSGDITQEDATVDVDLSDISVTSSLNGAAVTVLGNSPNFVITKALVDKVEITLAGVSGDSVKYSNPKFMISTASSNGETALPQTDGVASFTPDDYLPGKVSVRVIADTSTNKELSQTIIIDLQ